MSRLQQPVVLPNITCTLANTGYQVYPSTLYVKSVTFQALSSNASGGYVKVGDSTTRNIQLSPGRGATYTGDMTDNGTTAKMDLSQFYVESSNAGDQVIVTYQPDL